MHRLHVAGILITVLAVACGGQEFPRAATLTTPTRYAGSVPRAPSADATPLRADALSPSDVGTGWSVVLSDTLPYPSSGSTCAPGVNLPPVTAEHDEDLSYLLLRDGTESGHITLTLVTSPTTAEINARVAKVWRRPDFAQCVEDGVVEKERGASGVGGTVDGVVTTTVTPPAISGVKNAYRTVVNLHFAEQPMVVITDTVLLVRGHALADIAFDRCCTAFPPSFEARIISLLAARLARDFGA